MWVYGSDFDSQILPPLKMWQNTQGQGQLFFVPMCIFTSLSRATFTFHITDLTRILKSFSPFVLKMWQDTQGQGQLFGQQAVAFFKTSGLDNVTLRNIWSIADARQVHFLLREVRCRQVIDCAL